MALNKQDISRVISAIDMLLRAIEVTDNIAITNNLEKGRDIIANLLNQGRRIQEKKEG